MVKIAIVGASGRMGRRLIALAHANQHFNVVGALVRSDSSSIGADAGELAGVGKTGLPMSADLIEKPQVVIDFSTPASTRHWVDFCRQRSIAIGRSTK